MHGASHDARVLSLKCTQTYVGGETAIGKALAVTLRWAVMAGVVHTLRRLVASAASQRRAARATQAAATADAPAAGTSVFSRGSAKKKGKTPKVD